MSAKKPPTIPRTLDLIEMFVMREKEFYLNCDMHVAAEWMALRAARAYSIIPGTPLPGRPTDNWTWRE